VYGHPATERAPIRAAERDLTEFGKQAVAGDLSPVNLPAAMLI